MIDPLQPYREMSRQDIIDFITERRDLEAAVALPAAMINPILLKALRTDDDWFLALTDRLLEKYIDDEFVLMNLMDLIIRTRSLKFINFALTKYDINQDKMVGVLKYLLTVLPDQDFLPRSPDQRTYDTAKYFIDIILMNHIEDLDSLMIRLDEYYADVLRNIDHNLLNGHTNETTAWMNMSDIINRLRHI